MRLNRAVALSETGATVAALVELDALAADLSRYQPFHAARAELLARAGRTAAARAAYDAAIALAGNHAQRHFLGLRRNALSGPD